LLPSAARTSSDGWHVLDETTSAYDVMGNLDPGGGAPRDVSLGEVPKSEHLTRRRECSVTPSATSANPTTARESGPPAAQTRTGPRRRPLRCIPHPASASCELRVASCELRVATRLQPSAARARSGLTRALAKNADGSPVLRDPREEPRRKATAARRHQARRQQQPLSRNLGGSPSWSPTHTWRRPSRSVVECLDAPNLASQCPAH
jgi:hypothetical protein